MLVNQGELLYVHLVQHHYGTKGKMEGGFLQPRSCFALSSARRQLPTKNASFL